MNLIGAGQIRRAATAVSAGKVFDLSIPPDSRGAAGRGGSRRCCAPVLEFTGGTGTPVTPIAIK